MNQCSATSAVSVIKGLPAELVMTAFVKATVLSETASGVLRRGVGCKRDADIFSLPGSTKQTGALELRFERICPNAWVCSLRELGSRAHANHGAPEGSRVPTAEEAS